MGELKGALTNGFGDGLIGVNGGEPFRLGLALGTQKADQTQRLTLCSQLRSMRTLPTIGTENLSASLAHFGFEKNHLRIPSPHNG